MNPEFDRKFILFAIVLQTIFSVNCISAKNDRTFLNSDKNRNKYHYCKAVTFLVYKIRSNVATKIFCIYADFFTLLILVHSFTQHEYGFDFARFSLGFLL